MNDLRNFDKKTLINRREYPQRLRDWVYKHAKSDTDLFELATYICNSGGIYYEENEHGYVLNELPGICSGCKIQTYEYVCIKVYKKPFCLKCWFECDRKFI
tara:strand:+ start:87 stop:389 length:303 start_codon:yes stop_codon:yes gene_type:complete